ncbi:hypothetical protein J5N97_005099 [Dioscorea zingiberensis]|uniref:RING-type E3 ubiquitin transferase n=1 Tax=Dioscorea zingiberensis TaxID=325984 RepID=A0A9D5D7U8_9LILI|nr:hypothetical protein J5N97_005099 [Dioscorea zingiberensis]
MGSGKHRWRLSFHRSPSSSPSPTPDPPPEFVCPLASTLMADPVVVPSGHTFERSAIQACNDLHFVPPIISSFQASPLILIPNSALRSAILRWCELSGHPLPAPLPLESALDLVRRLMASDGGPKSCSTSSGDATASVYSVSSCSSSEIVEETPDDPLESEILSKLKDPRVSEQESALISLRRATREGQDRRISLCTRRLLAALRPLLVSRYQAVQANAVAALVNLSLEARNKSAGGAVPAQCRHLWKCSAAGTTSRGTTRRGRSSASRWRTRTRPRSGCSAPCRRCSTSSAGHPRGLAPGGTPGWRSTTSLSLPQIGQEL